MFNHTSTQDCTLRPIEDNLLFELLFLRVAAIVRGSVDVVVRRYCRQLFDVALMLKKRYGDIECEMFLKRLVETSSTQKTVDCLHALQCFSK